jgi:hypothetical protein
MTKRVITPELGREAPTRAINQQLANLGVRFCRER